MMLQLSFGHSIAVLVHQPIGRRLVSYHFEGCIFWCAACTTAGFADLESVFSPYTLSQLRIHLLSFKSEPLLYDVE